MGSAIRQIVEIDEDLCDGCGLCIPSCAEGAIQMVNGKAKLVRDNLCDGIGNCLGECPQNAIRIIEREAEDYSEDAVQEHLANLGSGTGETPKAVPSPIRHMGGCPGSASRMLEIGSEELNGESGSVQLRSKLRNWPVQLMLVPPQAPYFEGADVLIAADCVPFADPNFHYEMLEGKVLIIACPKLDDVEFYKAKLTKIFELNEIKSVSIALMEVPCCFGLAAAVKQAISQSGKNIPANMVRVTLKGEKQDMGSLDSLPF